MANKWQMLKGKYPDTPLSSMSNAADKSFLEKVDASRFNFAPKTLPELMAAFTELDKEKDDIHAREKEINVDLEALGQLIIAKFEEQGVNSVKNDAGRTFYLNIEPYVGVQDRQALEAHVEADPALSYLWILHTQSIASLVKGYLEEGQDSLVPPGLSIMLKTQVRSRKS